MNLTKIFSALGFAAVFYALVLVVLAIETTIIEF